MLEIKNNMVFIIFVIFVVLVVVICVIGVFLNSFVCLVFYKIKKFFNVLNIFIVSVVLGDLLYCVIFLLFLVVINFYGRWIYGDYGCKVIVFVVMWSGFILIMNLFIVGYERYIVLVFFYKS